MKIPICVLLACVFESSASSEDMADLGDTYAPELADLPTQAECASITRSLPAICKMFGKSSCTALRSKLNAKCAADSNSLELGEEHKIEGLSHDASVERRGRGRGRGRSMTTSGSFVMRPNSNRGGTDELEEEDLGEDEAVSEDETWDLTNKGKCNDVSEEAWIPMDFEDKTVGKCIRYAADSKCGAQCYHKGMLSTQDEPGAICAKICRVPGENDVECNIIHVVSPTKENGETMYLTRAKITTRDSNAKPMACSRHQNWS